MPRVAKPRAANPNAPATTDRRTPEEPLAIVEAKGRALEEALAPSVSTP